MVALVLSIPALAEAAALAAFSLADCILIYYFWTIIALYLCYYVITIIIMGVHELINRGNLVCVRY